MSNIHLFRFLYPFISGLVFFFVAWILSEKRSDIKYSNIIRCIILQIVLAICLLKIPSVVDAFSSINSALQSVGTATTKAVAVCFGGLANPPQNSGLGFILATQGLPMIIVISAISYLLTYLKILPFIINIFSFFFHKALRIGGTLGIAVSANLFTGLSETPLVVKPYLSKFSRSELFSLMVCGTAGTAGSVLVIYSIIVGSLLPNVIGHIITAAIINIPLALALSMIIIPPKSGAHLTEANDMELSHTQSALDAISSGIVDGAKVVIMIIIMIIGFIALIDIVDQILGCIPKNILNLIPFNNGETISLQRILGILISPLMFLLGIPWEEAQLAGGLIGTKIITNELVAFTKFAEMGAQLSEHSRLIVLYALCGFANLGSIGIIIGIYSVVIPERRSEVIVLGSKAVLAGTFSNCMCASLIGALT